MIGLRLYATGDDLDWFQELGFTRFKITNPAHYSQGDEGLRIIEEHVAKSREIVGNHAEPDDQPRHVVQRRVRPAAGRETPPIQPQVVRGTFATS